MAAEIIVPRLGWSMDEGTFVEWLKRDGDPIRQGEPLFALEGEKATEHIEAKDAGILRIPPSAPPPGAVVKVGQVLAYLLGEGEELPQAEAKRPSQAVLVQAVIPVAGPTVGVRRERAATPRARRLAKELDIDLNCLEGSGRGGRIRERDVRAAAD